MTKLLGMEMPYFTDLLKEAGLSKSDLAREIGVQKSTVSAWKDSPPQYVIWGLEYYVFFGECKKLKETMKEFLK